MTNQVEDKAHSVLGASSATRWMNCPASVRLIQQAVELRGADILSPGDAAREGTAAHHLAETCLEDGSDAWEYAGEEFEVEGVKYEVNEDMTDAVQVYLDHVRGKLERFPDCDHRIEMGLSSVLDDDAFGTSDDVIFVTEGDDRRIIITDYKHGRNIVVEPDSTQNKYYGALAVEGAEFDVPDDMPVELYIVQPRAPHPKGLVRRYVTTAGELTKWFANEVLPAMKATREEDALVQIGDWCRFCPAKMDCPGMSEQTESVDINENVETMTDEDLAAIMKKIPALKKYFEVLEKEAYERAMRGQTISGYKLVRKRANRTWKKDVEDAIKEKFGAEAYSEPKLKSPAQVEKLRGGKSFVTKNAYTPESGLTLAESSDKREEVKMTGEELFGDISDLNL